MAAPSVTTLLLITISISFTYLASASFDPAHDSSKSDTKQLYIVYMGAIAKASSLELAMNSHVTLLSTSLKISQKVARSSLITTYHKSFNGFAAMITPIEAQVLKGRPGVVSVFKSQKKKLLTTRSWDFIGLTNSSPRNPIVESKLIIGVIDTGIWPENPMFNDAGFGPIPFSWKGACIPGDNFTTENCNKKLIGAKYFYKGLVAQGAPVDNTTDFVSARDSEGHGSHTSSTAAGSRVEGANVYGLAKGTARGGAPSARVAMYKVCWAYGCDDSDILAAFDEAVHDGVHLLSISLGAFFPIPYDEDGIAIGSFHAMQKGIIVAAAAGNAAGFSPAINIAPWIITVAASSIDRQFYSPVTLGNNVTLMGTAVNTFVLKDDWYPLISGAQGTLASDSYDLNYCDYLDPEKVKGKIVYCEVGGGGAADLNVMEANGSGLILSYDDDSVAFSFVTSTSLVNTSKGQNVLHYINTTKNPIAKILPCDVATNEYAPLLAFFSSRGPHVFTPSIMKPDISAPGVDILAAWSQNASMTDYPADIDHRFPKFNIISGTSMATPHVAGAAAYVKSMHPYWSPAAIKSALMTTATPFDPTKEANKDLEFGYGAGQINPMKAIDPGLIYDISYTDYVAFLCTHGYNSTIVSLISGENVVCPNETYSPPTLNYPAIVGAFTLDLKSDWYNTTRTLKNVGSPNMTYMAYLEIPFGMEVVVQPETLSFMTYNEEKSFDVAIRAPNLGLESKFTLSASLVWACGNYTVKTPVVAYLLSF